MNRVVGHGVARDAETQEMRGTRLKPRENGETERCVGWQRVGTLAGSGFPNHRFCILLASPLS